MNILNFPYAKGITDDERKEAERLQAEFNRIDGHRMSLMPVVMIQKFRDARDAYLADPSDENFELLKRAERDKRFYKNHSAARSMAANVRRDLILSKIVPWAIPILQRALEKAREQLQRVKREEEARHLELTGAPMRASGIVDAAMQPVRHLEAMLDQTDKAGNTFRVDVIARMFGEIGPLSGPSVSPENQAMATRSRPAKQNSGLTKEDLQAIAAAERDDEEEEGVTSGPELARADE